MRFKKILFPIVFSAITIIPSALYATVQCQGEGANDFPLICGDKNDYGNGVSSELYYEPDPAFKLKIQEHGGNKNLDFIKGTDMWTESTWTYLYDKNGTLKNQEADVECYHSSNIAALLGADELEVPFNVKDQLLKDLFVDRSYSTDTNTGTRTRVANFILDFSDEGYSKGMSVEVRNNTLKVIWRSSEKVNGKVGQATDYDITGLVSKYVGEGAEAIPNNASNLFKTIVNTYSSMSGALQEAIKEEEEEKLDLTLKGFDNLTEIDKWVTSIRKYLQTGEDLTGKEEYSVSKFPGSLLVTEQNLVKIYAQVSYNVSESDYELPEALLAEVPSPAVIGLSVLKEAYNQDPPTDYTKEEVGDAASQASTDASLLMIGAQTGVTPKYNATYFEYISKYALAGVAGYGYKEQPTNEEVNLGFITTNDIIESIMPALNFKGSEYISTMDKMPIFGKYTDIQNVEELLNLYASVFYAESYISQTLTLNEDGTELICEELENLRETMTEEPDISQVQKETIVAYRSYLKGLEYLGIYPSSMSDAMKKAQQYLNDFGHLVDETKLGVNEKNESEPLKEFFNISTKRFTDHYLRGVALSATYIPLKTSVLNPNTYAYVDDLTFIDEFHYVYGFHRKGLYISTDVDAAVSGYVTGQDNSNLAVATLRDLLQPERDIVLYLDDNFYNIDTLAELQGQQYSMTSNADDADDTRNIWDKVSDLSEVRVQDVVKTGSSYRYSDKVSSKIKDYGEDVDARSNKYENAVLNSEKIDFYLNETEYSPMQSFAVVSSIYRDKSLFKIVQKQGTYRKPVFVSSPNLAGVVGSDISEFNSIYNYSLLKNITNSAGIDYEIALDLDSPVYIDIYGNILTASGIVVIPAASNATLHKSNGFSLYNAGFLTTYGDVYKIPASLENSEEFAPTFFYESDGVYELSDKVIDGLYFDFNALPYASSKTLYTLRNLYLSNLNNSLDFEPRVNLITEVLRGAPIENIDTYKEGLSQNKDASGMSTYMAYNLDELSDEILPNLAGNTLVYFPNLAFIDGVEYIVVFVFKAVFILLFFILFIQIYGDVIEGKIGLKTVTRFIATVLVSTAAVWLVPKLIETSYYLPNKYLLKDHMETLMILNAEKDLDGKEVSIIDVREPQSSTKFYIKLDDTGVSWVNVLDDVLFKDVFTTIDEAYEQEFKENLLANQAGVLRKSDGLYMDVDGIFSSSSIMFNKNQKFIYQSVHDTPTASYALPYYVILDKLIGNVNFYNNNNNIMSYTTKIMGQGKVATLGLIEPYLTSIDFMDNDDDILGMGRIYSVDSGSLYDLSFDEEELESMKQSMWYRDSLINDPDDLLNKLERLNRKARQYVVDNRSVLGKISDETFLKSMAMSLSLEYNSIFRTAGPTSLEIFEVDNRDLIRLFTAKRDKVLEFSSTSFARFIYEVGSTLTIIFAAILCVVVFISSIARPLVMLIMLLSLVASLIIHKMILRKENHAIKGYAVSIGLICCVNIIYSLILFVSNFIPKIGVNPTGSVIAQIAIQVAYMFFLLKITEIVLRDWRNMGYHKYMSIVADKVSVTAKSAIINIANATVIENNTEQRGNGYNSFYQRDNVDSYYNQIVDRDNERESKRWKRRRR